MKYKHKRPSYEGLDIKSLSVKNYLSAFSRWIANLGVVPLLLLAALRFFPLFTFLFSLLFLVTRVLETITQLLFITHNTTAVTVTDNIRLKKSHFSSWFILGEQLWHDLAYSVKVFALFYMIFQPLSSQNAYASSNNQVVKAGIISLAKGEIKQISSQDIKKFTVGNKEVISVKILKDNEGLLVKATHLGLSDLITWNSSGLQTRYQINVSDKRTSQKVNLVANSLRSHGIKTKIISKNLYLSGVLTKESQLAEVIKVKEELKSNIDTSKLKLSEKLKKRNYAHFLSSIYELGLMVLDCKPQKLYIRCQEVINPLVKKSIQYLNTNFLIQWIPQDGKHAMRQFEVTLTLQQYENKTGESFSLGLNRLQGNWEQILSDSPLSLIESNDVHIEDSEYKTSTLAHPKIVGRFNSPIKVQVGQEILFMQSLNANFTSQQWKFAGLDIDITLTPLASGILVNYTNSLSQPGGDIITKSMQRSSILTEEGQTKVLFDIGFQMNKKDQSRFPGLSKIPLFGSLFKNNFSSTTYKKVLCLIQIKEIL